jgi:hypothetical protein
MTEPTEPTFDKWGEVSGGAPVVIREDFPPSCVAIQAVDDDDGFQIQSSADRFRKVITDGDNLQSRKDQSTP